MKAFVFNFLLIFEIALTKGINITSKDFDSHCLMMTMSEKELDTFQDVWQQLNLFLPRYMGGGHKKLDEILRKYAGIDLQVSPDDPLESHIIQLQLLLHMKTLSMFERLEQLIQGTKPDALQDENKVADEVEIKNLKGKGDYLKNAYHIFNKEKILGSLSPFALPQDAPYKPTDSQFRPQDCSDLLVAGATESGVYQIYPFQCTCAQAASVYCDMVTDGGGWTVFLARQQSKNLINFTRNWNDYKTGFGSPDGEYWLGNEILHEMTSSRKYHLMVEAKGSEGRYVYGEWKTFSVDSEKNKFKVTLTTFDATQGIFYDRLTYVNGMQFTTFDVDVDKNSKLNCAATYKGGWWYNNCHYFNPTGIYGIDGDDGISLNPWSKVDSKKRPATWLQIKIRPSICSETVSVASLNTHNCEN